MTTSSISSGSVIDVNSLVNGLMKVESLPLTKIQQKIDSTTVSISSMAELRAKVDAAYSQLVSIEDPFFLGGKTASVNDPSVASVSVTSGTLAKKGAVSVSVISLATAQRSVISGFTSSSIAASGSGNLDIVFSGTLATQATNAFQVSINGKTLSEIRDLINGNAVNNGRVIASIVKTGQPITSGGLNDYALVLSSTVTGQSATFRAKWPNSSDSNIAPIAQGGIYEKPVMPPVAVTPPAVTTTQGSSASTETATLSSFPALLSGESLTIGGLTFTASSSTTSAETAAAFAGLSDGDNPTILTAPSYGIYTGTLSGWSSSAVSGSGSNSSLVFSSTTPGSNVTDLVVSASNGSTSPPSGFDFNQAATSASAVVDGISVISESNTLTTAAAGLSIELLKPPPSGGSVSTTIQVTDNTAKVKDALNKFAAALTDLRTSIANLTKPGSQGAKAGPLAGNSGVLALSTAINAAYFSGVTIGSAATAASWSNLGLSVQRDGKVSFDETAFSSYLASSGAAILTSGFTSQLKASLKTYKGFAGTIEKASDTLRTEVTALNDRYASTQKRLDALRASYLAKYSALDSKLSQMNYTSKSVGASLDRLNKNQ